MRPIRPAIPALLAFSLLLGGVSAGCAGGEHDATAASAPAPAPAMAGVPLGAMRMPTADEVSAAWKARPDYVRALPDEWQQAYAFALARPDVLQWLPCNCGCGGLGHRSNLDCFFKARESGTVAWEEHASYCDICVDTANLASKLLREGRTILEVRQAVDSTFGGGGHGTDTPLPPA